MDQPKTQTDRLGAEGVRDGEKSSLATAGPLFSLCSSSGAHSWSFRLLGGGGETDTHSDTKQRSLLSYSQRGGRQRCAERNYEFSAWKVQVLLTVADAIGINCAAIFLPYNIFMINGHIQIQAFISDSKMPISSVWMLFNIIIFHRRFTDNNARHKKPYAGKHDRVESIFWLHVKDVAEQQL